MPGLAVTSQFISRPPGFRLVLPWVRWLTPPAGIFRPPGCTIAGLVWNNEPPWGRGEITHVLIPGSPRPLGGEGLGVRGFHSTKVAKIQLSICKLT